MRPRWSITTSSVSKTSLPSRGYFWGRADIGNWHRWNRVDDKRASPSPLNYFHWPSWVINWMISGILLKHVREWPTYSCLRSALPLIVLATLALPISANGQATSQNPAATPASTTTLGVKIVVPTVYESTISSIGALATSSGAALKTYRSDARPEH